MRRIPFCNRLLVKLACQERFVWELKALLIVRKDQKALFLKNVFNKLNLPVLSMLGLVDCFIDKFKLKFK